MSVACKYSLNVSRYSSVPILHHLSCRVKVTVRVLLVTAYYNTLEWRIPEIGGGKLCKKTTITLTLT